MRKNGVHSSIAENGLQLQRGLEQEPALRILLQPTPSNHMARARCCAACGSFAMEEGLSSIEIEDDYRIVLACEQRQYFHVSCLEKPRIIRSLMGKRKVRTVSWNNSSIASATILKITRLTCCLWRNSLQQGERDDRALAVLRLLWFSSSLWH